MKKLEQKMLGYMLNNFEEIKRTKLEAKWFRDRTHRELAYVLLKQEQPFTDFSEIEFAVKEYYPRSEVTEEWLHVLRFEEMYVDDLKKSVKTLEANYIKTKAQEASMQYVEKPTEKNKEKLEDWLRELGDLDIDEDFGELKNPADRLMYELENDVEIGLYSYKELDKVLGAGLEGGTFLVIAGRPGTGKTAYAINMGIEILQKKPNTFLDVFSLEMVQLEMMKRFVSRLTNINGYKFKQAKRMLDNNEKRKVIASVDWLKNNTGLRIHDSRFRLSDIERMIRQRHYEARTKGEKYVAVVDYIGLVNSESNEQRNQQIGKISRTLKRLTNELDIPIILLSQLNRGVEHRESRVPMLADLRESGDLEQDADVVAFLSENKDMNHVIDFTIAKNRGGALATLWYEFYKPSMTFSEVDNGGNYL